MPRPFLFFDVADHADFGGGHLVFLALKRPGVFGSIPVRFRRVPGFRLAR